MLRYFTEACLTHVTKLSKDEFGIKIYILLAAAC